MKIASTFSRRTFFLSGTLALALIAVLPVAAAPKTKAKPAAKKPAASPVRRPLTVTGRVSNNTGKPLSGVEIGIYGTTTRGDRTRFDAVTNASGIFSQRVPDGIYGVSAYFNTTFNGKNYRFTLAPEDGKTGVIHDAAPGIVKNFRWKIAGLKPGERAGEAHSHTEGTKYYGGYAYVTAQSRGFGGDFIYFPKGSTLVMTFTPRGKLIDGSVGTPKTYKRAFDSDFTGSFAFTAENVPIGLYNFEARLLLADGSTKPLGVKRSLDFNGPFKPSAQIDFEPTNFGDMQMMQITVEPLFLPIKTASE